MGLATSDVTRGAEVGESVASDVKAIQEIFDLSSKDVENLTEPEKTFLDYFKSSQSFIKAISKLNEKIFGLN